MAANIKPIFSIAGNIGFGSLITASAGDFTGVSANYASVYTAGANGGYIERIRFKAGGTNVGAVMRIFINNGTDHTTASNNSFYGELTLPATTGVSTSGTVDIDYSMNMALPAGYQVYVGLGASVAAGWCPTGIGGNY